MTGFPVPHRDEEGLLHAVLGPTNTGKTHYAIERMLAHSSGIIGFPLRLLARENYERLCARKGASRVGLITGEEKIIPPGAQWFSCTVEAMPTDRSVAFVAVDEIQLCADPERGHIFTSRLLHMRGREETLFLGSETIAPLLKRLLPYITIDTRPRLSALTATGATRLEKLPARSAVVAFSAGELYAIAELLRTRRGGCAVIMGQMSPRTRNAQVALYQNREVDYLVATDAIGMGLNMDITHVAFAGLSKFDGSQRRNLTAAEIAQIAGRAGRGTRDGTFGTTGRCPPIAESVIEAVETHQFDPIEMLMWRNDDLDFTSPQALLSSLAQPSPARGLRPAPPASDALTLAALAHDPQIRSYATGRARTRQLWEVCQIPDFRKLGEHSHARLCGRIFTRLVEDRRLPASWFEEQLSHLDRTDGDVDTLMQRLAGIRVWSYIANRENWVSNAPLWQERTRAVEDTVSDALHERLTARFVDRRAAHLIRLLDNEDSAPLLSAVRHDGEVIVEGHPVGHMRGFRLDMDPSLPRADRATLARAARRAMRTEIPHRVALCCEDSDDAFTLDATTGLLSWRSAPVARLRPGPEILHPAVALTDDDLLTPIQRDRVCTRLMAAVARLIERELAPLFRARDKAASDPATRGFIHQLIEKGGQTPASPDLPARRLNRLGVRTALGQLYLPALMKPAPLKLRALLLAVAEGETTLPDLPPPGAICVPAERFPGTLLDQLGWPVCGPVRLRLDIAGQLHTDLSRRCADHETALPRHFAQQTGIRAALLPEVLFSLGLRLEAPPPLPRKTAGPLPVWILRRADQRTRRTVRSAQRPAAVRIRAESPFAALASLLPRSAPPRRSKGRKQPRKAATPRD